MKSSWIEIDLGILRENIRSLKAGLKPGAEIIFVVKSDAYGHGMVPVSSCARNCGVKWFAVSELSEAIALRDALPEAEILVIGVLDPADACAAAERNIAAIMVSESHARSLSASLAGARKPGLQLRCHVKVDTGMGRLGFAWEEAPRILTRLPGLSGLRIEGICTHFASAQSLGSDFAEEQAGRFGKVIKECGDNGVRFRFKHASNSGAILRSSAWDMDGVRTGILLYGYARLERPERGSTPGPDVRPERETEIVARPFLQWKARVAQVRRVPAGFPVSYDSTFVTGRETCLATIGVGYANGYSRALSNKGLVIIGGRRCPVAGRVTMNVICADLGPAPEAREWDEVVLLGENGGESVWADEMASWLGTIPYEVLTSIRADDRVVFNAGDVERK